MCNFSLITNWSHWDLPGYPGHTPSSPDRIFCLYLKEGLDIWIQEVPALWLALTGTGSEEAGDSRLVTVALFPAFIVWDEQEGWAITKPSWLSFLFCHSAAVMCDVGLSRINHLSGFLQSIKLFGACFQSLMSSFGLCVIMFGFVCHGERLKEYQWRKLSSLERMEI